MTPLLSQTRESMDGFLEYDTILNEHQLVDIIIREASVYIDASGLETIRRTSIYAAQAHAGQTRLSGEPYITHPLYATRILLCIKPDLATIQACILHDVIEDTAITHADITREFGIEVATLCEGMVKVSKVRYQGEDRQIETLKKTFLAMAQDLRVIFIKLADRIHNIQTLHFHPNPIKRDRIANETMKIYVPICKKLGLYQFQLYLENGAFRVLEPQGYETVMEYLTKHYAKADRYMHTGIRSLTRILSAGGLINFSITGRLKSPYRIYEKLITKYKTLDFSQVLDLIAFRVIVSNTGDCYNALGHIHQTYNPMINKIKDYIAVPKFNNYQSLHTTILGLFPFPVEIQIRTQAMHDIAEHGVAAHYIYKDHTNPHATLSEKQALWIKNLHDSVLLYQEDEKKTTTQGNLNIELLEKHIFVYTPKGDVIELSQGSTVLDFAFRVHTDVGLRFNNALVNGVIKPIAYILASGDVVSINTYKNKYTATKYRFDYLYTPTSKSKLTRFLKQQERELYITKGTDMLNIKLANANLPLLYNDKDLIHKAQTAHAMEHILMQIASKAQSISTLIKEYYPNALAHQIIQKKPSDTVAIQGDHPRLVIDGHTILAYTMCPVCKPAYPDHIIAKSDKDGIKIHTTTCSSMKTISYNKLLPAYRSDHIYTGYTIKLQTQISSEGGQMLELISGMQSLHIDLDSIKITKNTAQHIYSITITSLYPTPSKVGYILDYIYTHFEHKASVSLI